MLQMSQNQNLQNPQSPQKNNQTSQKQMNSLEITAKNFQIQTISQINKSQIIFQQQQCKTKQQQQLSSQSSSQSFISFVSQIDILQPQQRNFIQIQQHHKLNNQNLEQLYYFLERNLQIQKNSNYDKQKYKKMFMNKVEKILTNYQNKLTFQLICQIYKQVRQETKAITQIQVHVKHAAHFLQYCHQIVSQLSQATNKSLNVVFNSIRFILINLILIYASYSLKKIQKNIIQTKGHIYFNLYMRLRNQNIKFKDCKQRGEKAIGLAFEKIMKYLELINNQAELRKSANVQKMKLLYENNEDVMAFIIALNIKNYAEQIDNKNLNDLSNNKNYKILQFLFQNPQTSLQNLLSTFKDQKLLKLIKTINPSSSFKKLIIQKLKVINLYQLREQLNQEQNQEMTLFNKNVFNKENQLSQNQLPSQIYKVILELAMKEIFSTKILEKMFKKTWKQYFGYKILPMKLNQLLIFILQNRDIKIQYSFIQNYIKFQNNNEPFSFRQQFISFLIRDIHIIIIQQIKLFTMIITLPFNSFAIQQENQHVYKSRQINPAYHRKQPKTLKQIFKTLDLFYIYKDQSLNTAYITKISNQQLQKKLNRYIKYSKSLCSLFQEQKVRNIAKKDSMTNYQEAGKLFYYSKKQFCQDEGNQKLDKKNSQEQKLLLIYPIKQSALIYLLVKKHIFSFSINTIYSKIALNLINQSTQN